MKALPSPRRMKQSQRFFVRIQSTFCTTRRRSPAGCDVVGRADTPGKGKPTGEGGRAATRAHRRAWRLETLRAVSADFRGAKSTHIPRGKLQRFSRSMDAFCEVTFHPIGPRVIPLLRVHHLFIGSQSLAELPSRREQRLSAMARGNGKISRNGAFEYQ